MEQVQALLTLNGSAGNGGASVGKGPIAALLIGNTGNGRHQSPAPKPRDPGFQLRPLSKLKKFLIFGLGARNKKAWKIPIVSRLQPA